MLKLSLTRILLETIQGETSSFSVSFLCHTENKTLIRKLLCSKHSLSQTYNLVCEM